MLFAIFRIPISDYSMKAILLAAGEGKRMRPLTLETPKQMIDVLGKPLLYWIIKRLPAEITELVIVVGYKGDQIKKYFGERFEGLPITYVTQEKPTGTAHALALCRHLLGADERFLFIYADDLHDTAAMSRLLKHPMGVLAKAHPDPSRFGVIEADKQGRVLSMEEKPAKPKSNLVAVGVFVLDSRVFDFEAPRHTSGEYFLHDQVAKMIGSHNIVMEQADFWHPVGYPHDVDAAEKILAHPPKDHDTPVILIAGGKGTRLPEAEQNKPKCLVEVAGKPILEWQIEELRKQGFTNIRLALGYKAEMVVEWLKKSGNQNVTYSIEPEPLGTGGGMKLAAEGIRVPFLAFNCDDLADVSFAGLIRHSCSGRYNVITGVQFDGAYTFDSLVCDEHKKVCEFRQRSQEVGSAVVNIGHYYLLPEALADMPRSFSNERDLFPKLAKEGKLVLATHTGYWLTANNAEQIEGARKHFRSQSS